EQYPLRRQHCTIVQARLETTVALVESRDTQRSRMDVVHLLKPLGVLQVEAERERLDVGRLLAACLKKALEGMSLHRIQVPVTPGAKEHRCRNVAFPKIHGLPEHHMIDAKLSGLDRHGEAEWSCADDEKGYVHVRFPNVSATFGLARTSIASSRLESLPSTLRALERDENIPGPTLRLERGRPAFGEVRCIVAGC